MGDFAIKGHATRGSEVIEILEMLGGEDVYKLRGNNEECAYFEKNGVIYNTSPIGFNNIKLFTLEEFLEKFPYKVGDKVKNARINDFIGRITNARWDCNEKQIIYVVEWNDVTKSTLTYFARGLQPYKEQETMEEKPYPPYMDYDIKTIKTMKKEILPHFLTVYDSEENKHEIVATDGYEIKEENGKYYAVKKKPKYPSSYEECCEVLNTHISNVTRPIGWKESLIAKLQELLICRDAYWKIAGDEYQLGKPWEPDWRNNCYQKKWIINFYQGEINLTTGTNAHFVLVFPTKEMRDAFLENFKKLIEKCKELL